MAEHWNELGIFPTHSSLPFDFLFFPCFFFFFICKGKEFLRCETEKRFLEDTVEDRQDGKGEETEATDPPVPQHQ